jgi:serine protease AprX
MTLALPALTLRARTLALSLLMAMVATLAVPAAEQVRGITWTNHEPAVIDKGLAGAEGEARVVVQARPGRTDAAARAVTEAGGTVGAALPLIDGFSALVPAAAMEALAESDAIRAVSVDDKVQFEEFSYDDASTASNFARTSGASAGWAQGKLGAGVGVAVIDTGISQMPDFAGRVVHGPDLSGEGTLVDNYGHGTVMAGLIGGSGADSASLATGKYTGVAPKATLVAVKAAGRNGAADVSTMLQAMHWVASYKDQYNIRVLNLSWGTKSTQDPAVDPLNYAVQRLWDLGIVVVTAAGNSGPQAGTVTKPGDDPVVLTVGAYDDKQNLDPADDSIPAWSSRGPTAQGLVKPDIVAPGRTLVSQRSYGSQVEVENPKALIAPSYIKGSGSSQAAAVTSGLVAQLLEARPTLTPDQVKSLLKGTATPIAGQTATNQGSGRVNLAAAMTATPSTATQVRSATGLGSIEGSRGGMNVYTDCGNDGTMELIKGEIDVRCEAWNGSSWTGSSWTGSSWTGSSWTGSSWTGSSWTGSSWTGSSWTGSSWTGGKWMGSSWTGSSWTGSSWTGSSWTGSSWTGSSWTGSSWTGSSWTTAEYGDFADEFYLTAFWGPKPKPGKYVVGEEYTPPPPGKGKGLGNHFGPAV